MDDDAFRAVGVSPPSVARTQAKSLVPVRRTVSRDEVSVSKVGERDVTPTDPGPVLGAEVIVQGAVRKR